MDNAKLGLSAVTKVPLVGGVVGGVFDVVGDVVGAKNGPSFDPKAFEREMQLQFDMMSQLMSANMQNLQNSMMLPSVKALIAAQQLSVKALVGGKYQGDVRTITQQAVEQVTMLNRVVVQLAKNDGEAALKELEDASSKNESKLEETATVLYAKGAALCAQEKWAEAVEVLREALCKDEKLDSASLALGYCLGKLNDFDGAEAAYRQAIAHDLHKAVAHNNLGFLLKNVRMDSDGAERAYRKAIELDPDYAITHYNLGNLLNAVRRDYDGAETAYRKAIELEPGNALSGLPAHWNLSTILESKGDIDGAVEAIEGYIRAGNPDGDGEQRLEKLRAKQSRKGAIRTRIMIGQKVEVYALVARPDLNGRVGKVVAFHNDTGRFDVKVKSAAGGQREIISLKTENLRGLGDTPAAAIVVN